MRSRRWTEAIHMGKSAKRRFWSRADREGMEAGWRESEDEVALLIVQSAFDMRD